MSKEVMPRDLENIDAMLDFSVELAALSPDDIPTPLSYVDLADMIIRHDEYLEVEQANDKSA